MFMDPQLQQILDKVSSYDPDANLALITKAYQYASKAHENQKRISGRSLHQPSVEVALILADIEMDAASICAALLHDVVEDTIVTYQDGSGVR